MNSGRNCLQASKKHKKASSNYHRINYFQQKPIDNFQSKEKVHKKSKSFSKDHYQTKSTHFNNLNKNLSNNIYEQLKSKALKIKQPFSKINNQKMIDLYNKCLKSQSQSKRNKKTYKLEYRAAKSSPDKSRSRSAKKNKNTRIPKNIKSKYHNQRLKQQKQQNKQKNNNNVKIMKPKSREISIQNNSKDSKNSQKRSKLSQKPFKKYKITQDLNQNIQKQKKGIQINFKNISLKSKFFQQSDFPFTPQQIPLKFRTKLSEIQINQMKQYKYIYFLGNQHKVEKEIVVKSARDKIYQHQYVDDRLMESLQQNYCQTEHHVNQPKNYHSYSNKSEQGQFYQYKIGQHIAYRYEIISSINRGSFGQVLKVYDHKCNQLAAIKIVKKSKQLIQQTFIQISLLTHLKQADKGNISGIVRIKDFLIFRNHICILFQLLDGNLYQLLTANHFKGFSDDVIRVFALQLLNSLNFLRREKILHCDVKPENLVMNKWGKTGIKLIDFGTSCFEGKQMYSYLQSRYYRAPQVLMQMPYSYPIDMWSLGCILAQLKIGEPLFSGQSSIQQLIYLTSCIGLPNKSDGLFSLAYLQNQMMKEILTNNYLNSDKQQSFSLGQNRFLEMHKRRLKPNCMCSLQSRLIQKGKVNPEFLNFIRSVLQWQPQKRLSPQQALLHPWISKGLPSQIHLLYSAFNTHSSVSKSKKSSKQSKQSNGSKKRKVSKSKKQLKMQEITDRDKLKHKDDNRIQFGKELSRQI